MTTGSVDLKVVDDRLQAVATYLAQLRELPASSRDEFLADHRNPNSAESLVRRALEALLDVARHLLRGRTAAARSSTATSRGLRASMA